MAHGGCCLLGRALVQPGNPLGVPSPPAGVFVPRDSGLGVLTFCLHHAAPVRTPSPHLAVPVAL